MSFHASRPLGRSPSSPPQDGMADVISYISQLGLDDIDSLQARSHNKEGVLTDEELALALFAEEAEGLLNITRERAGSTSSQGNASRSILEELEELEALARYDHLVALAISEGRPIPPQPTFRRPTRQPDPFSDDDIDDSESSVSSDSEPEVPVASTSALPAQKSSTTPNLTQPGLPSVSTAKSPPVECIICGDVVETTVYRAPCGDTFDLGCLRDMFRRATIDESLFPPKCCQSIIPASAVRPHLDTNLMDTFDKKAIEFSTPSRVYCARPTCSAFIGATTAEAMPLKCPQCSSETCGFCKAGAHPGNECSDTEELNVMARDMHDKEGWQRCPSCHHLVELTIGCYHIICVCKAQFCYLCGTRWKGCSCPQFAVPPDV